MGRATNRQALPETNHSEGTPEVVIITQGANTDRVVFLSGDVNEHTISQVITQMIALANQNSRSPIHLVVSTYGGIVDEMFSLYDTIKFLPCPVYTIALGKVMSAGVLLLASGTKGKRMIGKNARLMMHPVSGGAIGNVMQVLNDSKEMQRQHAAMIEALIKETNMTKAQIEKIMNAGHDYYVTPAEAIKLGIVDKVVGE